MEPVAYGIAASKKAKDRFGLRPVRLVDFCVLHGRLRPRD
jgi:hypothetical protein